MLSKNRDAQLRRERDVLDRVRNFNSALDELMRLYTRDAVSGAEFFRNVTAVASAQLQVRRVSIWSLDEDALAINCVDLFEAEQQAHSAGYQLSSTDFPRYFRAMLDDRVIDAGDAAADPRTCEFKDSYLAPNNIVSMLDAQIRSAAGPRGVVCAESVGERRDWTPDEIAFVVSVAELVGFYMDREDRRLVHSKLEAANLQLQDAALRAKEANERYDLAMDAAFDGVWDWCLKTGDIYCSEQNAEMIGEPSQVLDGAFGWWRSRVHPEDLQRADDALQQHLAVKAPYEVTYRIRHADGSWRWWRSRGRAVRSTNGVPLRLVGTNSDVTDLILAKEQLEKRNEQLLSAKLEIEKRALHDVLTGLPNRRYMQQAAACMLSDAQNCGERIAFLHIDLDYFKTINDRLGHAAGDFVLKHVADVLREATPAGGFVARIGGDEFVAILPWAQVAAQVVEFADDIILKLSEPVRYEAQTCRIGASIGVAVSEPCDLDAARILSNADIALYRSKQEGRGRSEFYSVGMREALLAKRQHHDSILKGLEDGEFEPFFQPQFYAGSLRLAGVEALARWRRPGGEVLAPPQFLTAADELGCVADIDRQVLEKSMAAVEAWKSQGVIAPHLSVNVSGERLTDPSLVASVEALAPPKGFLSFELLESIFLDDANDAVMDNLSRLDALGVQIEIDDFGTGYASIVSLIKLRPRRLKIDRALVKNVECDQAVERLVYSIADIAHALDIEVVAEGVETPAQIEKLSSIGCHVLQGFGLGKPMSAEDFAARYRSGDWVGPLGAAPAQANALAT